MTAGRVCLAAAVATSFMAALPAGASDGANGGASHVSEFSATLTGSALAEAVIGRAAYPPEQATCTPDSCLKLRVDVGSKRGLGRFRLDATATSPVTSSGLAITLTAADGRRLEAESELGAVDGPATAGTTTTELTSGSLRAGRYIVCVYNSAGVAQLRGRVSWRSLP